MKTQKQAEKYAARIAALRGEKVYVFPAVVGSGAYLHGLRFGTFMASELDAYVKDGAKPVSVVDTEGTIVSLKAGGPA